MQKCGQQRVTSDICFPAAASPVCFLFNMNLHTFKDVVNAKKSSLVNDLDEGDEEKEVGVLRKPVEGEEDNGDDKV